MHEIEEGCSERCGCCVAPGNDEEVRLSPQFGECEAGARLRVFGFQEVVEEILTIDVGILHALDRLGFAVRHVTLSACGEAGEEDSVEMVLVQEWHGAALVVLLVDCISNLISRCSVTGERRG